MESGTVRDLCLQLKNTIPDLIVENPMLDDSCYLVHWLKMNKMVVTQTEEALRKGMKWRHEQKMDKIESEQFPLHIQEKTPILWNRLTKSGGAVIYYRAGHCFFPRLIKKYSKERMVRYWLQCGIKFERHVLVTDKSRKLNLDVPVNGKLIEGSVGIVDTKGYSMKCLPSIAEFQTILEVLQTFYTQIPAVPWTVHFINTNKFFEIMLRMLKPFIQRIGITIVIHGTDESKWTTLHEIIDPEAIREYQQTCNDMLAKEEPED